MSKGKDIFPRSPFDVELMARRRVERERGPQRREPFPTTPTPEERVVELADELRVALDQRNASGAQYERDAANVRRLVIECSRAGMGASSIGRLAGISHQRVLEMRNNAPEVLERKRARAAIFDSGGDVLVE